MEIVIVTYEGTKYKGELRFPIDSNMENDQIIEKAKLLLKARGKSFSNPFVRIERMTWEITERRAV